MAELMDRIHGAKMKICPYCAESILQAARKCRYCHEFLEGWTRRTIQQDLVQRWDGETRLIGFDLAGLSLIGAILTDANLAQADLTGADLAGSDLSRANLHNAILYEANLTKADLWEADLRQADLRGADLSQCSMEAADLSGADLRGANLTTAQWRLVDESAIRRAQTLEERENHGALLTDDESILLTLYRRDARSLCKEISRANFTDARYDDTTAWPPNFDPITAGLIFVPQGGC